MKEKMTRKAIQQLLSTDGFWTINKHLAKQFGFTATALLQQLIELQCAYFPNGDFYQQQDKLAEMLGVSEKILVSARKKLVQGNVLKVKRGHGAKYYYTVLFETISDIFDNVDDNFESDITETSEVTKGNIRTLQNGTANRKKQEQKKTKQKNILDVPSDDDIKAKMFFKLVDMYPKNRIGNRQHGLKKFKELDIEKGKLTLINLKRYLPLAGMYVKSLQNYITEECWSEAWLQAEETKNKKQTKNINNKNNAKSFDNKNKGFFE